MFLFCLAFTYLAFIIATNYIEIKWSLIPAAIVFILSLIAVYTKSTPLLVLIIVGSLLAMVVTLIKKHFEK